MSQQDNSKNSMPINSIASLLSFSGENVVDFLNNLLISQLETLKENAYHYTALCNPKGRTIATFWIKIQSQGKHQQVMMVCPKNMTEKVMLFFNMRKFRLKITIEQLDQKIWFNSSDLSIQTEQALPEPLTFSESAFYLAMFDNNLPWIDINNTEQHIPQHLNLDQHDHIMSFTKGCYPGQEIIARLKYLGKIKKRMVVFCSCNKDDMLGENKKHHVSPIIEHPSEKSFKVQMITKT